MKGSIQKEKPRWIRMKALEEELHPLHSEGNRLVGHSTLTWRRGRNGLVDLCARL